MFVPLIIYMISNIFKLHLYMSMSEGNNKPFLEITLHVQYRSYYSLRCILFLLCYFTNAAGFSDNDDDNDDDDGSQSMISTAASSRVSTAKSRASSARLTSLNRWSGRVGSSKPCSSVSSKKTNAWASTSDEKEEKAPPLVPSLFAHVPPTVYFFVEGEKGRSPIFEESFIFNYLFFSLCKLHLSSCLVKKGGVYIHVHVHAKWPISP